MRCKRISWLSVLGVGSVTLLSADALAADPCTGHKLLRTPRPELSCNNVKPRIYPSPDGTSRALVYPVDISLNATPDMESRVVIRSNKGETLTSKDYASPRGFNGYYVVSAKCRPTRNSLFTACLLRVVIRPGNFPSRYTVALKIASGNSAT